MASRDPSSLDWLYFSAITKEELFDTARAQRAQLVNVADPKERRPLRSIPGSRHIPVSSLLARLGELDRGRDVVVYGADSDSEAPLIAARMLARQRFHVRLYRGGLEEWMGAGLPTEGAGAPPP
jgi:rhodanese-related sulfurtransferase